MIINGELSTGLGGGVCQVSTTVFNAAYEAGLKITERTNHALYISHYPQGRDATVNYPDVDLKFVNDTDHWLLLRTFVGSSSLVVDLYGAPLHRRVESDTRPLVVTGGAPVKRVADPALYSGSHVGRGERLALELDQRSSPGLHERRRAPLRQHVVLVLSWRDPARPRGDEAEAGCEAEEGRTDRAERPQRSNRRRRRQASAVAISSASHPGTRVGRNVLASTQACRVQPSAIASPSRSTE